MRHLKNSIFQEKQKTVFFRTPPTFRISGLKYFKPVHFWICQCMLLIMKPPSLLDNEEYVLMSSFVILFLQNKNRHYHLSRFARSES